MAVLICSPPSCTEYDKYMYQIFCCSLPYETSGLLIKHLNRHKVTKDFETTTLYVTK